MTMIVYAYQQQETQDAYQSPSEQDHREAASDAEQ
jgi:hypothetical protein